jgi:preprotein translocase subunit SecA
MNQPITILKNFYKQAAGDPVVSDLSEFRKFAQTVKTFELSGKTNSELAERARQLTQKENNNTEPELFAIICEASRCTLGLVPYDTQIIAGLAMTRGHIAELPTGEGKTLAAVFPASVHAFSGKGVHVLTFNDYLARRDAAWMSPIYRMLGLSVGCIQEGMSFSEKRAAYACDVTYAAAREAGFDFLRDQIVYDRDELVHLPFNFALIDEADSILIDEARIPLVISGAEDRASWDANRLALLSRLLSLGIDYETDDEHRNVFLTDKGIEHFEEISGCGSLFSGKNQPLLEALYCSLHAEALLRRDVDYIVRGDKIEIVDEHTGRTVEKRHWPDGLQAAVEAKEGLPRKTEGRILGSITLHHFFHLYPALSGMTATARSAADEFSEFYGLKVIEIPPHISSIRVDQLDLIFTHQAAKHRAIVKEISEVTSTGRPILVGTSSIEESEELGAMLRSAGIKCSILNAKNDELEASIIAKAGKLGAITISTNMAGRGVDIRLGEQDESEHAAVAALGGLYVIGTNRHENLRIDRQLRGRSGRQGDPGMTRFFISLEDELLIRYGLTKTFFKRYKLQHHDEALESRKIALEIAHAQRIIEGRNFDIRRSLSKYSSLVEVQRQIIQTIREKILFDNNSSPDWNISLNRTTENAANEDLAEIENNQSRPPIDLLKESPIWAEGVQRFGSETMARLERRALLFHLDHLWSDHLAWIQDTRDRIHLVNLGGCEPINEFLRWVTAEFYRMTGQVQEAVVKEITLILSKETPIELEIERLKGPSSTWTYLVNDNQFTDYMELLKGKNIGFGACAAFMSPLLILALIINRLRRRRK